MSIWDWTFYIDRDGRHHWQRLCDDGTVLFESSVTFGDRQTCLQDAAEHGYEGTELSRPGVEQAAA